jgi:hypothetical protein
MQKERLLATLGILGMVSGSGMQADRNAFDPGPAHPPHPGTELKYSQLPEHLRSEFSIDVPASADAGDGAARVQPSTVRVTLPPGFDQYIRDPDLHPAIPVVSLPPSPQMRPELNPLSAKKPREITYPTPPMGPSVAPHASQEGGGADQAAASLKTESPVESAYNPGPMDAEKVRGITSPEVYPWNGTAATASVEDAVTSTAAVAPAYNPQPMNADLVRNVTYVDGYTVFPAEASPSAQLKYAETIRRPATDAEIEAQVEYFYSILPQEEKEMIAKYEGKTYRSVEAMPEDMRQYVLSRLDTAAAEYGVPPELLLMILWAERTGNGFVIKDGISPANAISIFQLTRGYMNGWRDEHNNKDGRPAWAFMTNPADSTGALATLGPAGSYINILEIANAAKAAAWGVRDTGGIFASLEKLTPAQRKARILDILAIYNSGKEYTHPDVPPKTKPYAERGLTWLEKNYPEFFAASFSPVESLVERYTAPQAEVYSAPVERPPTAIAAPAGAENLPVSLQTLQGQYKLIFENRYANQFTGTEAEYVAAQGDIVSEYTKSGNLQQALNSLYERQEADYFAHPEAYPFYVNAEYAAVQHMAVETIGVRLGSPEEIKALLDWSANQNGGTLNLEQIRGYLHESPQARVNEWVQYFGPLMMGERITQADFARMMAEAYRQHGMSFVTLPSQQQPGTEQVVNAIESMKRAIEQTPEFAKYAPATVRIKARGVHHVLMGKDGNPPPIRLRVAEVDKAGNKGPFYDHSNMQVIGREATQLSELWNGPDINLKEGGAATAWARIASPINGTVTQLLINSNGPNGDGVGDSVVIEGDGVVVRILHAQFTSKEGKRVIKVGQKVSAGEHIGYVYDQGANSHPHLVMAADHGNKYELLPAMLMFGPDFDVVALYGSGTYKEGDVMVADYYGRYNIHAFIAWFGETYFSPPVYKTMLSAYVKYYKSAVHHTLPRITQKMLEQQIAQHLAAGSEHIATYDDAPIGGAGLDAVRAVFEGKSHASQDGEHQPSSNGFSIRTPFILTKDEDIQSGGEDTEEVPDSPEKRLRVAFLSKVAAKLEQEFGYRYTFAFRRFALDQIGIYQDYVKKKNPEKAAAAVMSALWDGYRKNPAQEPFLFSKEAENVQRAAVQATGSFLKDRRQVEHTISLIKTLHGKKVDEKTARAYFKSTPLAELSQWTAQRSARIAARRLSAQEVDGLLNRVLTQLQIPRTSLLGIAPPLSQTIRKIRDEVERALSLVPKP